ncbi:C-GCAxxG-C-C family (seleno)protein [Thermovenabulum sp.]|uniref:C-GCAxxG-C-C family (seleno)protein n=1 Tax=Thermovenabulum sp. TaxID=3100335 RepID=UPI003C7A8459
MDCLEFNKQKILDEIYKRGYFYEGKYRGCAQAVIAAIRDFFEIDDLVFKCASGFSGGIADEAKGTCGAFSGCVMVISYFFGRSFEEYGISGSKFKYRSLIKQIRERFEEEFGGETCPLVQTKVFGRYYNFSKPDEKEKFEEAGAHKDKCTHVVGLAAMWLADVLIREGILLKNI